MKTIYNTIMMMRKRPILFWLLAIVVFVYLAIDKYNPLMPILLGLGRVTGGTAFEGIISFLQIIIDPAIFPYVIIAILGISIAVSLLLGIFLSGYFNVLNNGVLSVPKKRGEFISGVRIHWVKTTLVNLRIIFFGIFLFLFMAVSAIPAIVLSKLVTEGKAELNTPSLLIGILTVLALYFIFMFIRTYVVFWYPGVIQRVKKPFQASRKLVNRNFWRFAFSFLLFDISLIGFYFLLGKVSNGAIIFILKWLFFTLFILLYVSYIFRAYETYKLDKAK
jgi:hypothetical protein